jgi:hypothetical protein
MACSTARELLRSKALPELIEVFKPCGNLVPARNGMGYQLLIPFVAYSASRFYG